MSNLKIAFIVCNCCLYIYH